MINHPNFFPQYASTIRHHDYLFIYFGCENLPRINLINSVWNNTQPNSSNVLTIVPEMSEGSIRTRFDVIERRKAEWEMDKKTFESLMTIVGQNLENDNFYNEYRKLRQTLVDETMACNEVLNARTQQSSWQPPRNHRLAFWLR